MKSFFKFLSNNKLYTAINLFGLAVSLMFVILIADYSSGLLGVDRFHEKRSRIYLIGNESGYSLNHFVSMQLQDHFPEIEEMCGIAGQDVAAYTQIDNQIEVPILFADSTFFDIFSFPVIYGDPSTALNSRDKAVVTKTFALKMFGSVDVVGKSINLAAGNENISLEISAVIEDLTRTILPHKTEIIIPFINTTRISPNDYYSPDVMINGGDGANKSFILVKDGADLNSKLEEIHKYLQENDMDYKLADRKETILTPLPKVMLDPHNHGIGFESGNRQMLLILLSAGIAILIFAVTNYINLTVAQTGLRSREMACRKLLGSSGSSITARLIGESTMMTAIAFAVGYSLALIFEQYASSLCNVQIDLISHTTPLTIVAYLLFIIFVGFISGSIPAITLSKYKPIDIVRGSLRYRSKMLWSKIFIIFQNIITVVLIVSSMVIYLQINHLIKAPLGISVEGVIEGVDLKMTESEFSAFHSELQQLPCVDRVGRGIGSAMVMGMRSMISFTDKTGNEKWISTMKLDSNAIKIFKLELVSDHLAASESVYLNEAAVEELGIGIEDLEFTMEYGKENREKLLLGGVFKNFKLGSILNEYSPLIIYPLQAATMADSYTPFNISYIKVNGDPQEAYKAISEVYHSVTSRNIEDAHYHIASEYISNQYREEKNTASIILIFAIIAIIISALGLFAMSTYFTRQRIKEIGIRKIFGGTRKVILNRQLWSFVLPLLISITIATPVSWFIMDRWLQNYTYRIPIYPWIYLAASLFILIIGILTVLGQSLKAVNSNPIKAIRTE